MTNPYAPPSANLADVPESLTYVLARRWRRFAAAVIDGLLQLISLSLVYYCVVRRFPDLWMLVRVSQFSLMVIGAVCTIVLFLLFNGRFLAKSGQTIGKLLFSIRIVRTDGSDVGLCQLIFRRYIPVLTLGLVPMIGWILQVIDVVFIFEPSRKCLHDLLADTVVVYVDKGKVTGFS